MVLFRKEIDVIHNLELIITTKYHRNNNLNQKNKYKLRNQHEILHMLLLILIPVSSPLFSFDTLEVWPTVDV